MTLHMELLASAREADAERLAAASRFRGLVNLCRRRLLGLFPVAERCEPCTT